MECLRYLVASDKRRLTEVDGTLISCELCKLSALIVTINERRGIRAPWQQCRTGEPMRNEDFRREALNGTLA